MKIKLRYILASLFIGLAVFLTPLCIDLAFEARGYEAVGGEYLIIPFSVLVSYVTLSIARETDEYKSQKYKNSKERMNYGK